MTAGDPWSLLPFDREAPCPACGIALEIRRVCRESHPGLSEPGRTGPATATGAGDPRGAPVAPRAREHLDVVCPGCGWSSWMQVAAAGGR